MPDGVLIILALLHLLVLLLALIFLLILLVLVSLLALLALVEGAPSPLIASPRAALALRLEPRELLRTPLPDLVLLHDHRLLQMNLPSLYFCDQRADSYFQPRRVSHALQ